MKKDYLIVRVQNIVFIVELFKYCFNYVKIIYYLFFIFIIYNNV